MGERAGETLPHRTVAQLRAKVAIGAGRDWQERARFVVPTTG